MCTSISILHLFIFERYKSDIFFISICSINIDKTRISIIVWERARERNPTKDLLRIEEALSALSDTPSKMVAFRLTFWKRKKKRKSAKHSNAFENDTKFDLEDPFDPLSLVLSRGLKFFTATIKKACVQGEKHRWSTLNSPLRGDQRVSRIARGTAATSDESSTRLDKFDS